MLLTRLPIGDGVAWLRYLSWVFATFVLSVHNLQWTHRSCSKLIIDITISTTFFRPSKGFWRSGNICTFARYKLIQTVVWICIRIRIHNPHVFGPPASGSISQEVWIRIRILLSSSKNSNKNLDTVLFCDFFWTFFLKNDVNVTSKSNEQKLF